MLKLYILRHGKAVRTGRSGKDFDRELNNKGTAQINQIGELLARTGAKIDQIIASSAKRTVETAEIANFHLEVGKIQFNEELYLAELEKIHAIFLKTCQGKSILLVGHNFGLSDYVNFLVDGNLLLSTGMLVEINFNFDNWNEIGAAKGVLVNQVQPKVLAF